jgi:predicted nucleic acid-binding protein
MTDFIKQIIETGDEEAQRARELQQEGFQTFDALHIACAESANVDIFLSTDDRLLKTAKRASGRLRVRIENPLVWIEEITR